MICLKFMEIREMIFWETSCSSTKVILTIDNLKYKVNIYESFFDDGDESEGGDTLTDITFIGEGTSDGQIMSMILKSYTS